MAKYYEFYETLILATTLVGVYFPSIEEIYGKKWNVKLLKLIGILPGISYLVFLISIFKYVIFDVDVLENKIYGWALLLIVFLITYSFFAFHYYKKELVKMFELWDTMFQEDLYSDERQVLLEINRNHTLKWMKTYGYLGVISAFAYVCVVYTKENKVLNHPSGIPYRHQSPDFELVNTLDMIVSVFGLGVVVVFDSMSMTLLSMEEAQINHLRKSIGKIVDTLSVTDSGKIIVNSEEVDDSLTDVWKMKDVIDEVDKKLRIWVSHHQQILRFHRELREALQVPLAIKFSIFVLVICLIGFLIVMGIFTIIEVAFATVVCVIIYGLFYSNIMYADTIGEESESIFVEAFGNNFYLYPKYIKDIFLLIQLNSQRPVQFTAFKIYPLTSRTFLRILSSAYSIFTFMIQTNSNKMKTHGGIE